MDAVARQLAKAQRALDAERIDEAVATARDLVKKHPRAGEPLHFLGRLCCAAGKPSAGLPYLRRAVTALPDDPRVRLTLAEALAGIGLVDEAIATAGECVNLARRLGHVSGDAEMLLGGLLARAGRFDEAERCLSSLAKRLGDPAAASDAALDDEFAASFLAAVCNNLANVRVELGRQEDAVNGYRQAIVHEPKFADAWTNLATTLFSLGRVAEAAEAARRAVALAPRQAAAWLTLGNALSEQGRWSEARRAFDALLALDAMSLAGRYNRSLARLALGEWSAWDDYRLRHAVEPTIATVTGLPRWRGESLAGRTILVRREQGIGTQVMFSGYLPGLANLADTVIVECDPRLQRLFQRTMPGIEFAPTRRLFANREESDVADGKSQVAWRIDPPDVEVAIGDLPGLLASGKASADWTAVVSPPRLTPDAALIRKWRDRLARIGPGLCVGVSWRGGGTATARRKRSTALDQWSSVLALRGVHFVSLQYGDCRRELSEHAHRGGTPLDRWDDFDPGNDLDDLAALSAALDLVVSIDNSTAHLAAAVGAATWVLLPAAADWRWPLDRDDTPWYPTATLIRQRDAGEWEPLFDATAQRIRRLVLQRQHSASRVG